MRRFDDGGTDSYSANRYRGQHGQISFITGSGAEESKLQSSDGAPSLSNSTVLPTSLAPVLDFQRRGRPPSPTRRRDDVIDVDTAYTKPTIAPYMQQQQPPPSRYYPLPSAQLPPPPPPSSSSYNVDSMVALLYELRSSLSSEQEQRKLLHAQLSELRASTQVTLSDLRSSVVRVVDDVKSSEGRLLQLSGRVKEVEVQSTVEGRLQEKSERIDERALLAQQSALQKVVADLHSQLEEQGQRHREDLDLVHREHQRALTTVKEQAMDARQVTEERMAQQAELFSSRLQVAMERMEGGGAGREEVAALTQRMAALQGECSAMELSLREMRDMSRREGDDATSKGDWVRTLMSEQMHTQGRALQEKLDVLEEGRRALTAAQQREAAALRDELDRRLKEAAQAQAALAEREREGREELEGRVQHALKVATTGLSSLIKDTVTSLSSHPTSPPTSPHPSHLSSTLSSLNDSHSELEAVLRAEIKTRMKLQHQSKARLDLLQGQVEGLKAMVGEEGGEVRKVREELKEEGRKLEKLKERMRELKTKGEEGLEREHRAVAEVEKRVQSVEEMRRRVDGSMDEVRRKVEVMEELRRRVDQLEAERQKASEVDELKRRVEAVERDTRKLEHVDELRRDVQDIQRSKLPALDALAQQLTSLKQAAAERERTSAGQQQALTKEVQGEVSSLRTKVEALERGLTDRVRELDRAQRDDERSAHSSMAAAETEWRREVEGLRREVKDAAGAVVEEVRRMEEDKRGELADELVELERRVKARVEGVMAEVAELKGERRKEEEEREAEESMMSGALEARAVLDDMVSAVEHSHQQQRVDHLRQHLDEQLIRLDERVQQCEAALGAHAQPMVPAQQEPQRGEELQQLRSAVTALQQAVQQQQQQVEQREEGWKQQMQATRVELLKESKEATVSAKELLAAISVRVVALEDAGSTKDDYGAEMSSRLLQQLTEVEVKLSRMGNEWAALQAQQRKPEPDSSPPSARGDGEVDAALRADVTAITDSQREVIARVEQLSEKIHVLAIKHAELGLQLAAAAASDAVEALPQPAVAQRVPTARRPSIAPELASQMSYLQQAVTSQLKELGYQVQQQQSLIDAVRAQVDAQAAAAHHRRPSEVAERGSLAKTPADVDAARAEQLQPHIAAQLADITSRLSASEQWRAGVEQAVEAAASEQRRLQLAVDELKERLGSLQSRPSGSVSAAASGFGDSGIVLLASVASRASTANPAAGEPRARPSIDAQLASQSDQVEQWQQRSTADVAALQARVNDLDARLAAESTSQASSGDRSWMSALEQLQQSTASQLAQLSHRTSEEVEAHAKYVDTQLQHLHTAQQHVELAVQRLKESRPAQSVQLQQPSATDAQLSALQQQLTQQVRELEEKVNQLSAQLPPASFPLPSADLPSISISSSSSSALVPAMSERVDAAEQRVSQLVSHVQRLESTQSALRSEEAKEMEAIVQRISSMYQNNAAEQAAVHEELSTLRLNVEELTSASELKHAQLVALDEAIGDELRHVLDDMHAMQAAVVRVEGEGKAELLLLQKRTRDLEGTLGRLHAKLNTTVTGDAATASTEEMDSASRPSSSTSTTKQQWAPLLSYREHREKPRQAPEQPLQPPYPAPRQGQESRQEAVRTATSMASLRMEADDGSHDAPALQPAHHSHVSIDHGAHQLLQDRPLTSIDDLYEPPTPAAAAAVQAVKPLLVPEPTLAVNRPGSRASLSSAPPRPAASAETVPELAKNLSYRAPTTAAAKPESKAAAQATAGMTAPLSVADGLSVSGSRVAGVSGAGSMPVPEWRSADGGQPRKGSQSGAGGVLGLRGGKASPTKLVPASRSQSRYENELQ